MKNLLYCLQRNFYTRKHYTKDTMQCEKGKLMNREWYKKGEALLQEIKNTTTSADDLALWPIGQCGFIFKYLDTTLYIDPVLTDLTNDQGETVRYYPAPYAPEQAFADYVLCTHGHIDHLEVHTLKGMLQKNPKIKFLIPGGCTSILLDEGFPAESIIPLKARESYPLDTITITPVCAAHPVHAWDENGADLALSYLISFGDIRVLHTGDTYLTDQLFDDYMALPTPDLFLPAINGGDYFRTRRDCIGNLSIIEAATLATMLKTDMTIPMHYDMIKGNTVDPLLFVRELWSQNSAARFRLPVLGEKSVYQKYGGIKS